MVFFLHYKVQLQLQTRARLTYSLQECNLDSPWEGAWSFEEQEQQLLHQVPEYEQTKAGETAH